MPNTAIKFTYSGNEILFDIEEIGPSTVQYLQDMAVNVSQNQAPTIYFDGNSYQQISVSINEIDEYTAAKIATLKDVTEELTFYYRYGYDGGVANMKVIPVIDDDTETWVYGEKSATITHTMKFLVSG